MAVSSYNHYLFLVTLILSLTLSSADQRENEICSKTQNPTYCLEFLNYFYKPGTSLKDLANQTIESSITFLDLTYDEIRVREKQALIKKKFRLSEQFNKCEVQYIRVVKALIQSKDLLRSGNLKPLPSLASFAMRQARRCDLNFVPIGSEPADFKSLNEKSVVVCSVVVAVMDRLVAGGV